MLLRLSSEQIADYWDAIEHCIEQSAPPVARLNPEAMNKILESLLVGRMQAWMLTQMSAPDEETGNTIIEAVAVTALSEDVFSGTKGLVIYSLSSFRPLLAKDWAEGFYTLSKFAKSLGCEFVSAYTNEEYLMKVARKLGGEAEFMYIKIPVFND